MELQLIHIIHSLTPCVKHRIGRGCRGDDDGKDNIKYPVWSPHSVAESLLLIHLFLSMTSEAGAINVTWRNTLSHQRLDVISKSHTSGEW